MREGGREEKQTTYQSVQPFQCKEFRGQTRISEVIVSHIDHLFTEKGEHER